MLACGVAGFVVAGAAAWADEASNDVSRSRAIGSERIMMRREYRDQRVRAREHRNVCIFPLSLGTPWERVRGEGAWGVVVRSKEKSSSASPRNSAPERGTPPHPNPLPRSTSGEGTRAPGRSGEQVLHHMPVDVGQAEIAAGVAVGEPFVVEAEQVQDRGVQVVDVDGLVRRGSRIRRWRRGCGRL